MNAQDPYQRDYLADAKSAFANNNTQVATALALISLAESQREQVEWTRGVRVQVAENIEASNRIIHDVLERGES